MSPTATDRNFVDAAAASTTSDPPPQVDLTPGYVATTVGQQMTVTTTRPVVLGQKLNGIENAVELPTNLDFTLFADKVTFSGKMVANGCHILIVAREVDTAGVQASISVRGADGKDNSSPFATPARAGTKQEHQAGKGDNGGPGGDGDDAQDGMKGGDGVDGGSIRIYCQNAIAPFLLELDASGGRGGNGQCGQDGGDGAMGGRGFDTVNEVDVPVTSPYQWWLATQGGPGGLAGRGGAGGAAGAGGKGGTIEFAAAEPDAARPSGNSVEAGAYGVPGLPGVPGKPGAGGPGGEGTHESRNTMAHVYLTGDDENRYYDGAGKGRDAQTDGVTDGTTTFRAASGKFVVGDANRLLAIEGRDLYFIEEVTNGTTLRLSDKAPAAEGQKWSLITTGPWVVSGLFVAPDDRGKADGTTTFVIGKTSQYIANQFGPDGEVQNVGDAVYIANRGFYRVLADNPDPDFPLDRKVDAGTGLAWVQLKRSYPVVRGSASVATGPDAKAYALAAAKASEEYFYMQADRARFIYLSADPANNPDAFREANERLLWVLNLLAARTPDDPAAMARLAALYSELDAMRKGLPMALDYFGHGSRWAPPLTYDFYAELLPAAIEGLIQAETSAANNRQKAVAMLQKGASLRELAEGALADITKLNQQNTDANALLVKLTGTLADQDAKIVTTKDALESALREWMRKQRETVDWMQTVDAAMAVFDLLTQIAFLPEDPAAGGMAALKTIGLIGGSIGKSGVGMVKTAMSGGGAKITGNSGQQVPVKYELTGLKSFGDSADDLKSGIKSLKGGALQADTSNEMLAGPKKALDDMLNEFSEAGGDEAKSTRQAMDDYTDAVVARNETILQYNEALVNLRTAQQGINAANALYAQAQDQKAEFSTIGLAEHLVDRGLDRARLYCLEVLYLMGRAYRMFTLQDNDTFYDALQLDQAWEFDAEVASNVKTKLTDNWTNAYAKAYSANAQPNFNQVEDYRQAGIRWSLKESDYPDLFVDLRKSGKGSIKLPPSHREHATGPFAHMANVRLRLVRCWLEGGDSESGLIKLLLTRQGDDTFVRSEDDQEVSIVHDPTAIPFWYRTTEPSEVGTWKALVKSRDPDAPVPIDGYIHDYAGRLVAMGPFATWEIQLLDVTQPSPDQPVTVDLSNCHRITFEFFVFFQTFS